MGITALAIDPSLTSTGWVVFDLETGRAIEAGVVRTGPAKKSERLTAAEDMAARGVDIRRAIGRVMLDHKPVLVVQEGNAGSRTAKVAAGLARAQQACADAVDTTLGGLPMIVTPQSVKKAAVGGVKASKGEMQAAALKWCPSLAEAIQKTGLPGGQCEHIYDATCVMLSVWRLPAVASLRAMAAA